MALFNRKQPDPKPCPQCSQLLAPDALTCNMCGLDMREMQPVTTGAAPERADEKVSEPS